MFTSSNFAWNEGKTTGKRATIVTIITISKVNSSYQTRQAAAHLALQRERDAKKTQSKVPLEIGVCKKKSSSKERSFPLRAIVHFTPPHRSFWPLPPLPLSSFIFAAPTLLHCLSHFRCAWPHNKFNIAEACLDRLDSCFDHHTFVRPTSERHRATVRAWPAAAFTEPESEGPPKLDMSREKFFNLRYEMWCVVVTTMWCKLLISLPNRTGSAGLDGGVSALAASPYPGEMVSEEKEIRKSITVVSRVPKGIQQWGEIRGYVGCVNDVWDQTDQFQD